MAGGGCGSIQFRKRGNQVNSRTVSNSSFAEETSSTDLWPVLSARFWVLRLIIVAAFSSVPFIAFAQTEPQKPATDQMASLRGTVSATEKGYALTGATVILSGDSVQAAQQAVTTDDNGRFEFRNLTLGVYTISVEADGFSVVSRSIELKRAEQNIEDFVLVLAAVPEKVKVGGSTSKIMTESASAPASAPAFLPLNDDADAQQSVDPLTLAIIKGKVVDQSGTSITGAVVKLTRDGKPLGLELATDEEGQYFFIKVPPGPFQLTISCEGLVSQTVSGTLHPSESYIVPLATLTIATQVTEVHVGLSPIELAQEQVHEQEKQRVFGIIPNFYVSYSPDAAPLSTKQKFQLAWKSATDPVTLVGVGMLAGIDQAADRWGAYGQGMQGYAKRYGATYADIFATTYLAGAVLPTVLKQDPRYFYKATGSKKSRLLYAIRSTIICKGDNRKWQPNYSAVVGDLAGAGMSNLWYPPNDRNGAGAIFGNTAIRFGEIAISNILQEFIIPKLTPNLSNRSVHK